jgi:hypothetical protein
MLLLSAPTALAYPAPRLKLTQIVLSFRCLGSISGATRLEFLS